MKESLENHLSENFKIKDSLHYLALLQKIKSFADAQLTDSAGKSDQERGQILFNTLLNIRDTASVELVEYTLAKRVEAVITEYNQKDETEVKVEAQEDANMSKFEELQINAPKKTN